MKATEAARIIGITRDAFVHRARTGQIPNEGRDELGHRMFSARKMWGLRRRFRASESAPPSSLAASAPGAYPSSAIAAFIADGEVAAQVFKLLKQGASRADVTIELSLHPDVVAHHADKYQEAVRPRAEEAAIQEINQLLSERGLEPMAAVGTQELHRAFLRVAASADAFRQERDSAICKSAGCANHPLSQPRHLRFGLTTFEGQGECDRDVLERVPVEGIKPVRGDSARGEHRNEIRR